MTQAYISGALTKTRDIHYYLKFYEELGALCETCGIRAFVPHIELEFNPDKAHSTKGAEGIFRTESEAIRNSTIIVACLDDHSTGVGAELQLGIHLGLDILAFHHHDYSISRYIRGMLGTYPKAKLLEYENKVSLFETLEPTLLEHLKK